MTDDPFEKTEYESEEARYEAHEYEEDVNITTELNPQERENPANKYEQKAFALFGDWFKKKRDEGRLEFLESKLEKAHSEKSADIFAAKWTLYAVVVGTGGLLFGGILGILIFLLGQSSLGTVTAGIIGLIIPVFFVITGLFGTLIYGYLKPKFKVSARSRRIDLTLPYAITFLYALSRGGMSFIEALRQLAESEDAYGEVSRECQSIIRDIEYFSFSLPEALIRASYRSPSQKFSEFTDDTLSVIDSGADMSVFLEDTADQKLREAEEEQKQFIDFLAFLGEIYVTVFVAAPLFLIIITVIMAMLGGASDIQLYGIVYALLPIMNVGFFLLIDILTTDEGNLQSQLESGRTKLDSEDIETQSENVPEYKSESTLNRIISTKQNEERYQFFKEPVRILRENPHYTTYAMAPIAVLYLVLTVLYKLQTDAFFMLNTFEWFILSPVFGTTLLFSIPFFFVALPYSIFYEMQSRRENSIMKRLPDTLKSLSTTNAIGLSLTEGMKTVAENTSGVLGEQLEKVSNDISWYNDINTAMSDFANRIKSPVVSRTVKLITQANKSTGDIQDVLEVAATDVRKRRRLEKKRKQEMLIYTAVILVSYLVYTGVIIMIDSFFLAEIASIDLGSSEVGGGGGGVQITDVPVGLYKMVFFHSTIIQAIGSGLLAGQLASNDPRDGLKFTIPLLMLSTVAFLFFS